ncbi:MAG: CCE_0567 family metalloprotein [Pseudomonadota bacterium]|nr:hypothetical protein [Pseudomonadales bacterium]MDY6921287.1 CCE_0567 family metalloprotein [Pseudomonadota bacterium]|tara:strand:- start:40 stop:249 length:210 start_codon:yes stop_codon:yes gene_type:complete
MTEDELKTLKKEVSSKKRIATDWASKIHDVVEDSLWSSYQELPDLAQKAVSACEDWASAKARYDAAAKS